MSYLGTNKIGKIYLGTTAIAKAYKGTDLVFGASGDNRFAGWTEGQYPTINSVGSNANMIMTPYFPLNGARVVSFYTGCEESGGSQIPRLCTYKANKTYIDYWGAGANYSTRKNLNIYSSSAYYLRIAFWISKIEDCYIYDETNGIYIWKGNNVT